MAIQGKGISFAPLYWTFHDNWKNYTRNPQGGTGSVANHYGHTHLFMLGYDWSSSNQDAFSGSQEYAFRLDDVWGPRSTDPNQQHQYTVVGTPKWYFHLEEIWRRVYIQPWDMKVNSINLLDQRGVRYDAAAMDKHAGPFREGRDGANTYAPFFMPDARTLPIDYYDTLPTDQAHRSNNLADRAKALFSSPLLGSRPSYDPATYDPAIYDLQHGNFLQRGLSPAAVNTFSDNLYIWPLIEYQKVVQLNWERFPGMQAANDLDAEHFGDGYEVKIEVPFRDPVTKKYRSPFCPSGTSNVAPVGQYYNSLVPDGRKPRYATVVYDDPDHPPTTHTPYYYDNPAKMPPERSGQLVTWQNPYGEKADGRWVQQCLGGVVRAKTLTRIRHRLGGETDIWTHATNLQLTTSFAGTDQGRPA